MKRAYYSESIEQFLLETESSILGKLTSNHTNRNLEDLQINAWKSQIQILKDQLRNSSGKVYFEFAIPRMGKRVDNIIIINDVVFIVDNAGWHTSKRLKIPKNITLIPLPPYSPELNPMEQVWQWMKHNYLSNICFDNYQNILDKLTQAWNAFANNIELVKSICQRNWINV